MIINEITGQRIAEFTVDGIPYTERTMFVVIPDKFRELFDGHSFKDMQVFSKAIFYANCSASYEGSPMHGHTVKSYASALQYVLDNDSF